MNRFKFESFSTTVKGRCLEFEALKSGHIQPIILFFWYSRSQTFTAERLIAQISNTEQFWVHHCMSETHKSLNWETGQIIIISITVRQTAASWHIHNIHITYSTGLKTIYWKYRTMRRTKERKIQKLGLSRPMAYHPHQMHTRSHNTSH